MPDEASPRRNGVTQGPVLEASARSWRFGNGSIAQRAVFIAFIAGVFGSLLLLVHPWYDLTVDGSIYLVTARSLAAGDGYTYLGEPFRVRPPGFSCLLAPLLSAVGTNFFVLNLFVGLFGATGVVLLFWFERPRLGFGLALLSGLAVWLNPGYERLSTQIMSDVPGATLLLLCLLVERWARQAPGWRREVLLGLCIGLSAYVRSLLILLVPAIAVSRLLQRRTGGMEDSFVRFVARRLLPFAAVVALVLAPWWIRNQIQPAASPADQTVMHSYGAAMWHTDPHDPNSPLLAPGEVLDRIPLRFRQMASVLGSRLRNDDHGNDEWTGTIGFVNGAMAALFVTSALVVLARRREPAEIFLVGALISLSVYFDFAARLILPVFLLALPAAVEVTRDLVARLAGARAGSGVAGVALVLLIALDFEPRRDWDQIERSHLDFVEIARAIDGAVARDARIGAVVGAHYSVLLDRPVYSLQIAAKHANALEAAERIIEKHGIDTIALSDRTFFDRQFSAYFRRRYGEPQRVGPALIWRIPSRAPPSRSTGWGA